MKKPLKCINHRVPWDMMNNKPWICDLIPAGLREIYFMIYDKNRTSGDKHKIRSEKNQIKNLYGACVTKKIQIIIIMINKLCARVLRVFIREATKRASETEKERFNYNDRDIGV